MVYRLYGLMIILSLTLITVGCQSFQYSKGWTNGKRSDILTKFSVQQPSKLKLHNSKNHVINEQTSDPTIIHCDLQNIKVLFRGNDINQFYLMPCELLHILLQDDVKLNKLSNQLYQRLSIYEDINDNDDN